MAESGGYDEDEGAAGVMLFGRLDDFALEYGVQHNDIEVLVVNTGDWFALPPSGSLELVVGMAAHTSNSWTR